MRIFLMKTSYRSGVLMALASLLFMLMANDAMAGTAGTEFSTVWSLLTGWVEGLLGRIIAIVFVIVGLVAGVVRGSIMGFVLGIASGVGLFAAPTIITNIVTATI
jgi:conjugal transfer pilus assembly protein TraA